MHTLPLVQSIFHFITVKSKKEWYISSPRCYWEVEGPSQLVDLERGCTLGCVSPKFLWLWCPCTWDPYFVCLFLCGRFEGRRSIFNLPIQSNPIQSNFSLPTCFVEALTSTYLLMWWADLQVLNEYPQVQSISAFSSIYNNSGLFGIKGTTVMFLFKSSVNLP